MEKQRERGTYRPTNSQKEEHLADHDPNDRPQKRLRRFHRMVMSNKKFGIDDYHRFTVVPQSSPTPPFNIAVFTTV